MDKTNKELFSESQKNKVKIAENLSKDLENYKWNLAGEVFLFNLDMDNFIETNGEFDHIRVTEFGDLVIYFSKV